MFVSSLNEQQQRVLLYLADLIIDADGVRVEDEVAIRQSLADQCVAGTEKLVAPIAELGSMFDSQVAKRALLLELLGVAHADGEYHSTEKATIREVAQALEVEDALLEDMSSWVYRQFALLQEAQLFMEEA